MAGDDYLARAEQRVRDAHQVLAELGLLDRWRRYGDPVLCGSVAYGLVVEPDIDLEVFTDEPSIDDGFELLHEIAKVPGVARCAFTNGLAGPDQGLYWRIVYDREGVRWNVDNWLLGRDHPGPLSTWLVEPMLAALTPTTREAVLEIKEAAYERSEPVQGIWVYRAVLEVDCAGTPRSGSGFEPSTRTRSPTGLRAEHVLTPR
ncbi:hypothetical protein [Actinopolymorpha pittospori]